MCRMAFSRTLVNNLFLLFFFIACSSSSILSLPHFIVLNACVFLGLELNALLRNLDYIEGVSVCVRGSSIGGVPDFLCPRDKDEIMKGCKRLKRVTNNM
jgi:hypothetical protein